MITTEEQKIVDGIIEGNERVLKDFYQKNYPYIKNYILQNSGTNTDVDDVFQDGMIFLYQKLTKGEIEIYASLSTYFYSVCRNIWRNRLRKEKRMVLKEKMDYEEGLSEDIIEEIYRNDKEALFRKHFFKLKGSCIQVLEMVFQGLSMREIASATGYSENYARKKKFECKKRLIEMIEDDPLYKEITTHQKKKV